MSKVMERKIVAKKGIAKGTHTQSSFKTRTTHLSDKSTSRMSHKVQELNKKVLQYINN